MKKRSLKNRQGSVNSASGLKLIKETAACLRSAKNAQPGIVKGIPVRLNLPENVCFQDSP